MFHTMIKIFLVVVEIIIARAIEKITLTEDPHYRVRYGRDAVHGEYPYAVVLIVILEDFKDGFERLCTGSMIAEQWALIAAHCVPSVPDFVRKHSYIWYDNFTVSPLETNLFSKLLEIFIYPGYRPIWSVDKDIALLRVSKINMQSYGILSAIDHTTLIGLPATYIGGGRTERAEEEDKFRSLQIGEAAVVICHRNMKIRTKYLICIASKCSNRQHRMWFGDSGGPLIVDGKIVGVNSFGSEVKGGIVLMGCSPVNPFLDWIHTTMNSEK